MMASARRTFPSCRVTEFRATVTAALPVTRIESLRSPSGTDYHIESKGGNRRVFANQSSRERRETDFMLRPAGNDQRQEKLPQLRGDIRLVKGPGMVASEASILLDQRNARLGLVMAQGQDDQSVL